ncbi:MAG: methylamine utilization protein [Gammaproteobacteria bacterium]|nr:methylamine utilization protein [Gammaproteobacteria bacterium]
MRRHVPTARLMLACLLACGGAAFPGHAGELKITLVDQDGAPIEHAAVLLDMDGLDAPPSPVPAVMDQRDRQFLPYVLAIRPGAEVSFPNSDNIRHHVYSFSEARPLELKLYSGTPTEPLDFPREGIVTLGCNIHDWMLGFIVVSSADRQAISDAAGQVMFRDLPDGEARVRTWHPRFGSTELAGMAISVQGDVEQVLTLELGPELRREPPALEEQRETRRRRGR